MEQAGKMMYSKGCLMTDYNDEEPHYLLDSNIVSEIIKPNPSFNVIKKIAEHNSDCAICMNYFMVMKKWKTAITKLFLENI